MYVHLSLFLFYNIVTLLWHQQGGIIDQDEEATVKRLNASIKHLAGLHL